ncbi:MAG: M61 family peptidase [Alysiella sp.]|uniref:M61 family metallopeptidase n=1 Tax=Alysiella sp. TaxID=1872483 RepID=UPI0026DB6F19|nr:PDZ domain-containing protein [Alysiella sp.]MDO4433419.1 M61 family peptidase [Alysiella sp.]
MMHYTITPHPQSHQWHISLTFQTHASNRNILKLANWVAGSYMIRDFSRHIMSIQAACNGKTISLTQQDKNTWTLPEHTQGECQIDYIVYANDLSVRASLLDTERGFIDGACLFLYQPDRREEACTVQFKQLPENWQVHTTLPQTNSENCFQAASYAELTDHPFELGANLETLHFVVRNIPHRIVLSGHYRDFDRQRLIADCQKICEYELQLFPQTAPFSEYLFLLHLGDKIYGGLEHISSTALHADRNALPPKNMGEANPAYTELLGLIAHEYFHAWNIKSIKPQNFQPYDFDREIYTEQLWAFEGITSYYDDLTLVRSRVITPKNYLNLLAQNMTRVHRNAGRKHQTLAQSSFAAWHKYYKQDENSPNAITSYYQQGALAALCLDLIVRTQSQNQISLDSIMRQLYQDWLDTQQGLPEKAWQQRAQEITQLDLNDFFQAALYSTEDLPLQSCLKSAGIALQWLPENRNNNGHLVNQFPENPTPQPEIGCRSTQQANGSLISHVFNNSAAEQAGLKAGDTVIAINHFACTDLAAQTQTAVGDTHVLHFFRHGVLHQTTLTAQAAPANCAYLKIEDETLLLQWLFG